MGHKTQCTENLFGRRKYLPDDPAPPAHVPASVLAFPGVQRSAEDGFNSL